MTVLLNHIYQLERWLTPAISVTQVREPPDVP